MKLVIDDLHDSDLGPVYMDVVLSAYELDRIRAGEMINAFATVKGKRFYVGALREGRFFYEEEDLWKDED